MSLIYSQTVSYMFFILFLVSRAVSGPKEKSIDIVSEFSPAISVMLGYVTECFIVAKILLFLVNNLCLCII